MTDLNWDDLKDFCAGPLTYKGPMTLLVPDTPDGHKILEYLGIPLDSIEDCDD